MHTLLILQSILSGLQVVNAMLTTANPPAWLTVTVAAVIAALQNYVQHIGNEAIPKHLVEAGQMKRSLEEKDS